MLITKEYPFGVFSADIDDSLPVERKLFLKNVIEQHFDACAGLCRINHDKIEREILCLFKAYTIESAKICEKEANLEKAKIEGRMV